MKKLIWIALAATLALVSCKKETGQPQVTEEPEATEAAKEAPVAVQFSTIMPDVIETKGLGPLDEWRAEQKLYVYGIARKMATEGEPATATTAQPLDFTPETGIFIPNKIITFPSDFFPTTPSPSWSSSPRDVNVYRVNDGVTKEPYFYDEDRRYEFFGYFVDDAADAVDNDGNPNPTQGENDITLGVTINGSQDIMLAHADKDADNEAYGLNPNRLYSAYSARRGVKPNLSFEHQLSRFNVYIRSGSTNDAVTAGMTVSTVKVKTLTKGTLTIATKEKLQGLAATAQTEADLPIWNAAGVRLDDDIEVATGKYVFQPTTAWPARTAPVGTIMVMPGETKYEIKVGVKQEGYSQGEVESTYYVDFSKILAPTQDPKTDHGTTDPDALDTRAMAGHAYDVNMVVYGLETIDITISMSEWLDAGSFVINPEDDSEIKVTPSLDPNTPAESGNGKHGTPYVIKTGVPYQIVLACDPELESAQTVTYASKNEAVATVSAAGVITAVAPGTTRITINVSPTEDRPEGGYAEVWVTVSPQLVLGITGTNSIEATIGDADVQLADLITVKDNADPANNVDGATVTYVSSDTDVATVSAQGVLHFVAVGTANITVNATKEGYLAATELVIPVTVSAVPNQTMTITASNVVKNWGDANFNLDAPTAKNATTDADINPAFSFAVKEGESVTVTEAGAVTIVKGGITTITITGVLAGYDNGTKDITVTVNKAASAFTLASNAAQVTALATTAEINVTDGAGAGAITAAVIQGGNEHIAASYDSNNHKVVITATGATAETDNCTVRVTKAATDTHEAYYADITVTVAKADQSFTLSDNSFDVAAGTASQKVVTITDGDGDGVISVTGGNEHITVAYEGTTITISATAGAVASTDNCTITVTKAGTPNYNECVKTITVTVANP